MELILVGQNNDINLLNCEEDLLGTIYSVTLSPKDEETNEYILDENRKIKLDKETIAALSKKRLGKQISFLQKFLDTLIAQELLIQNDSIYALSNKGRNIGRKVRSRWISEMYDNLLLTCANSKAYAKFCNEVFGKNLLQFNVIDMQQLDMVLEKLQIQPRERVLDLGCGLGKITEYIAQKTKTHTLGIDFSSKAIDWANTNICKDTIEFEVMDISEIDFPDNSFDVILAFDVLYWLDDLEQVLPKIRRILKPKGRLAVFYVLFRQETEPTKKISQDNNAFTYLLSKNGFTFESIDVSQEAIAIWQRKLEIGEKIKPEFEQEGNLSIIESRLTDGINVIKKLEEELQKRYFYLINKKE